MIAKIAVCAVLFAATASGMRARTNRTKSTSTCAQLGCNANYDGGRPCQCNSKCAQYGNCCSDYTSFCFNTCAGIGCGAEYDQALSCQCNYQCARYGNCCSDYDTCGSAPAPSPVPSPPPVFSPTPTAPGAAAYWEGVNMQSKSAVQERLRNGATKLSYGGLWTFYKSAWVGLPGKCTGGGVFDVYSDKCWTPGSGQCGTYKREGDCYNREHSWPKSWWGRDKIAAYSDVFHVMPSDGYVNGRRSSFPLGEVDSATYKSGEGNEVGPCVTPGYSGTVFEPTDKVKGTLARNQLYMTVRYAGEFSCCSNDAVIGDAIKPWYLALMLRWNSAFPPQPWEVEFNNRAQRSQGNRNPFIDYPELGEKLLR